MVKGFGAIIVGVAVMLVKDILAIAGRLVVSGKVAEERKEIAVAAGDIVVVISGVAVVISGVVAVISGVAIADLKAAAFI